MHRSNEIELRRGDDVEGGKPLAEARRRGGYAAGEEVSLSDRRPMSLRVFVLALATAAQLAPPDRKGQALSITIGEISVAWVAGVPAGAVIVDRFGWRASFALAAALTVVAATGVRYLLPVVANTAPTGGLASRLAVAGRPAVLVTLLVTVLAMAAGFTVLTYVRPLLEGFSFSLLSAVDAGSAYAIAVAGTALVAWGAVVFALISLQQHHLIGIAPEEQSGVLSLNSSAVYVGQGLGAGLGSLIVGHGSLVALGYAGLLGAAAALVALVLGARLRVGSMPLCRARPGRLSHAWHSRAPASPAVTNESPC